MNGPDFNHDISFSGEENLQNFCVQNIFHCAPGSAFTGRIVLGEGVFAFCEDEGKNIWSLCTASGKKIWIVFAGKGITGTRLVNKNAAWYVNKLTPTQTIEYFVRAEEGICDTAVQVYDQQLPPRVKGDR